MKNKFLIILMSFSVMVAFCQNETFTKKFTRTKVLKIDFSKIYYKKTGEKIKENEFVKLVKNNPNLQIENIIGIDGEIEKYLVFFEKNIEKKGLLKEIYFQILLQKQLKIKELN
jgi:hypothetical protein